MGQNPPIQLVGNLPQQPIWTCNEIININEKQIILIFGNSTVTALKCLHVKSITHLRPQEEYQPGNLETQLSHLCLCALRSGWKTWSRQGMKFCVRVSIWVFASLFWIVSHQRCFATDWMVFLPRVSKLIKTKWSYYSCHL